MILVMVIAGFLFPWLIALALLGRHRRLTQGVPPGDPYDSILRPGGGGF